MVWLLFVLIAFSAGQASAQSVAAPESAESLPSFEPPPPPPPAVIARDDEGRVTVRAMRLAEPLVLDGQLKEPIYEASPSFGGFIQQEPAPGEPATERSEIWVFFDEQNVYVSARFWKSNPDDLVANEMRKDESGIFRNDCIGVVLDTFYDRRSGYYFNTNALGAVRDALLVNENQNANLDFNPVWDVRSHRFDAGWSTEMAIPFKSLRYPGQRDQVWGLLVQRIDWKKNEISYLTHVPPSYGGAGIWKVSSAATLVGIQAPVDGGRLEVKPYALSSVTTDREAVPAIDAHASAAVGLDVRYKLTKSLNADLTYNTDFAQVEVDNQQLNLTRFSLFYPEKREFFLEMQNILSFGPTTGPGTQRSQGDPTPILFFSRQIGLANGLEVPIIAGGRVLGRAGPYTTGAFTIRTGGDTRADAPATTFSVVRARRNLFRRSGVGVLATHRSRSALGSGDNTVLGIDTNLRFFQNVEINGYYARSRTPGIPGDEASYLGQFRYTGDRYGLEAARLGVGDGFNPEIGFLPRHGFTRNYAFARFSPRLARWPAVRKLAWEASIDRIAGSSGALETQESKATFRVIRAGGDELNATLTNTEDVPRAAFGALGTTIPAGPYEFSELRVNYVLGPQRPIVGTVTAARGGFYGGDKTEVGYSGRLSITRRFMTEPSLTLTWLSLPQGRFSARLIGARTTVAMTPRMFAAALIQYNSITSGVGSNVRFRWEYQPGSDLFVVYSEARDTRGAGMPIVNRTLAIKFTRLLRM